MGDYQPLRSDGDCDININNRIKEESVKHIYYKQPMSRMRAVAFVLSILLCFVTIFIFLWVVPCDWNTCPQQQAISWDRVYHGLELKGPINVVNGPQGHNLVAMFQGAFWGHNDKDYFKSNAGGIISLIGSTGVIAWWTQLINTPSHLDCTLIDADQNGINDCLVQGTQGYLGLIDSLSGVVVWIFKTRGQTFKNEYVEDISFPVVLSDINGDGVNELLAMCRFSSQTRHTLVLLCGKSGNILGIPFESKDCADIDNLMVESKDSSILITYTCKRESSSESYNIESLTLQELLLKITNQTVKHFAFKSVLQTSSTSVSNEWVIGKHRLSILNTGHCPTKCSVVVNVSDEMERTVFTYNAFQTYVMKPVAIHFDQKISGFLLKFWHWLGPNNHTNNSSTLFAYHITEQIRLVTFNGSKPADVVNASQADIVQLCTAKSCQPKLESQTDSLLLVDLDEDGFQELISYTVTYKSNLDECLLNCTSDNLWKLQTKVRVIRLQAELPKLYEIINDER